MRHIDFLSEALSLLDDLQEDLQSDYNKFYSFLDRNKFIQLIELDPTFTGTGKMTDSKGSYGRWIIDRYKAGDITENDIGHVKDCLTRFQQFKGKLKEKDINKYKTLSEIDNAINDLENNLTPQQIDKENKKAMRKADYSQDKVFSSGKWDIYVPSSYANSCAIAHMGDDEEHYTSWCTASTDSDYYYNYYKNDFGGEYYIIINRNDPQEKYQFHFESNQFMDASDQRIDVIDFFKNNPDIKEFFTPNLDKLFQDELSHMDDNIQYDSKTDTATISIQLTDLLERVRPQRDSDAVDGEWIIKFLEDGVYVIDRNWFFETPSLRQNLKYFDIDDYPNLKRALKEHNVDWDTLKKFNDDYPDNYYENLEDALFTGQEMGIYNQIMKDIKRAIDKVLDSFNLEVTSSKDSDYEATDLIIFKRDNFKEAFFEKYFNDELDEDISEAIIDRFADLFVLYEPQYGWNDFSEEWFAESLLDSMSYWE